ncbi:MAG: histidinol-phosphate transaminase [Halioglobus sp.]
MSRFWSDIARGLTPYTPGEQPRHDRLVKLNTNEFPYPPSPKALAALSAVEGEQLRRYPDPESSALTSTIAAYYDLKPEQVFVGNGSDEVLAHAFQGLLKHTAPILFPDISYSFYPVWCDLYGIHFRQVPLDESFRVNGGDYAGDNGGIIIPNPNAPTGIALELDAIKGLLDANRDCVVIIDEAYVDFGAASAVELIADYDNLLVIQTLSKSRALAGLRVGFALGHKVLIEGLTRVKNSFNSYPLGLVSQRAAVAAFEDGDYFRDTCAQVVATRDALTAALAAMGFEVLPSAANFVFARHPKRAAQELVDGLRAKGVIVRHFQQPRISEFMRITVGTDQQCQVLLAELAELV